MIILGIVLWIMAAVITAGIMMHIDNDFADDPMASIWLCLVGWWIFFFCGIGIIIGKILSMPAFAIMSFLDHIRK